jgi:hypothetical protein
MMLQATLDGYRGDRQPPFLSVSTGEIMLRLETLSLLLVMLLMSATLADDLPKSVAAAEEGDFDAMLNVGLA